MAVKHSHSALQQFDRECERRFFYQRILKIQEPPSHYLSIGNFYHAAIAWFLLHGKPINLETVLFDTKKAEGAKWTQDVPDEKLIVEVAAALLRLETEVFPHLKPKHVEAWSNRISPASRYCAKIDVVSEWTPLVDRSGKIQDHMEKPCVIDWKTVFSVKRSREAEGASQLALYCLETGVKAAGFVEINRDPQIPIHVTMTEFDEYSLARWRRYFDTQFGAMDSRGPAEAAYKLAPPGFPLCSPRWCPFWKRCPGGEGAQPPSPAKLSASVNA